jgi:hypothetical protein
LLNCTSHGCTARHVHSFRNFFCFYSYLSMILNDFEQHLQLNLINLKFCKSLLYCTTCQQFEAFFVWRAPHSAKHQLTRKRTLKFEMEIIFKNLLRYNTSFYKHHLSITLKTIVSLIIKKLKNLHYSKITKFISIKHAKPNQFLFRICIVKKNI